jgi:hypothetical protein
METKQLVLQRDEAIEFDGDRFEGIFGNREQAARLRNRLERVSQNHRIHVGTMEPHGDLPSHVRELIGTWHKGAVLKPKNGKAEQDPGRGFGHVYGRNGRKP